ncbi:MAG TPA: hypothetical protein VF271_05045 [Rhodanobacteraceae bacterium]
MRTLTADGPSTGMVGQGWQIKELIGCGIQRGVVLRGHAGVNIRFTRVSSTQSGLTDKPFGTFI